MTLDEPETWISWDDDGVWIFCAKDSCMGTGANGLRYWGQFDIPGYRLQPKDIDKAFMEHKVAHSS